MKTSNENRWAFKVLAGSYLSEDDLEALGISADWHLYLSPTEPPSAAQCNQQMNAYDLSACPCCGGRATIIGTLKTCEWSAICTMCGLETAHMMQPKDAALAWNKRHAPDEEGSTPPESGGQGEAVLVPASYVSAMTDLVTWLDSWRRKSVAVGKEAAEANGAIDAAIAADASLAQGGGNER